MRKHSDIAAFSSPTFLIPVHFIAIFQFRTTQLYDDILHVFRMYSRVRISRSSGQGQGHGSKDGVNERNEINTFLGGPLWI